MTCSGPVNQKRNRGYAIETQAVGAVLPVTCKDIYIITSLASIPIIMSSSVVSATPSIRSSPIPVMAGVEDGEGSSYVESAFDLDENDRVPKSRGRPKGKRK